MSGAKRGVAKGARAAAAAFSILFVSAAGAAGDSSAVARDLESYGQPVITAQADPGIEKALAEVSAGSLRSTIEKLASFGTRNTLSSMANDLKPGEGILPAADWIQAQFEQYSKACGGCLQVKRNTFTAPAQRRIPAPTTLVNVYAILRGTDPADRVRTYLVTGHYDSRNTDVLDPRGAAPGANDDASGTAVSLECARVLSRRRFHSTLVFAAVAGEEQGLLGSAHLAQLARLENWRIDGVLNNDIVGGNTTPGDRQQDKSRVRVFSEAIPNAAPEERKQLLGTIGAYSDSPSRELARQIREIAQSYLAGGASGPFEASLVFRLDRFLRGGDHASFNHEGFAAVRLTEWREDFNHQHQNVRVESGVEYGDVSKFVDFEYVAQVARLNLASLAVLASAPPPPEEAFIITQGLDNSTTLHWKCAAKAPVSFEIVWRETSAPDWQRFAPAQSATGTAGSGDYSTQVPISPDNVIFGVRSVSGNFHSIAVTPVPER